MVKGKPTKVSRAFMFGLAERLKLTYTIERRAYESMLDRAESRYTPPKYLSGREPSPELAEDSGSENFWLKAARTLYAKKIDPIRYVRLVFHQARKSNLKIIDPKSLLSASVMRIYQEALANVYEDLKIEQQSCREIAKRHISNEMAFGRSEQLAVASAVSETPLRLPPLFRFCLAHSTNDPYFEKFLKHIFVAAALEYMQNKEEYDKLYGEWIPKELRDQAEKIYYTLAY